MMPTWVCELCSETGAFSDGVAKAGNKKRCRIR